MADGPIKEKFGFDLRHRWQPLFEGPLLAKAARMWPVVEDQDGAGSQARTQIPQAIECRQIDVTIDAHIGEFLGSRACGLRRLFSKKPSISLIRGRDAA